MEKHGLVSLSSDRHLELTGEGRTLAIEVMRKHRLAELLLANIIGLEWHLVHEEACRWEHVMSEQVERKILELVQEVEKSPFGNPIPGLEHLGRGPSTAMNEQVVPLIELLNVDVEVARIAEPLQSYPDALAHLAAAEVIPGAIVRASQASDRVEVRTQNGQNSVSLTAFDVAHIFVKPL
jgi:DtxR family Mn-dependent transcriptional regulator